MFKPSQSASSAVTARDDTVHGRERLAAFRDRLTGIWRRGPGAGLREVDASIRRFSSRRGGHVVLILTTTLGWAFLWALFDILVVHLAFPQPLNPASNCQFYWIATWDFAFPMATFFSFREHAWLPLGAVLLGGWEDILFYWTLGVVVPPAIPAEFYVRAAVFLPISIVAEVVIHRYLLQNRAPVAFAAAVALLVVAVLLGWLPVLFFVAAFLVYAAMKEIADVLRTSGDALAAHPLLPPPGP